MIPSYCRSTAVSLSNISLFACHDCPARFACTGYSLSQPSLPTGDRRQKRHFVPVAEFSVHSGVVEIHGARNRPLVWAELRIVGSELPPDAPDRRSGRNVTGELRCAGNIAQPGEQPHRYAHALRSASRRAVSSSGSAVAPSIQTSPPSKNSRFQIGATCFTRSITYRQLAYASARWGEAAAIATLASPISSLPTR